MKKVCLFCRTRAWYLALTLLTPFSLLSQSRTQTARSNTVIDAFVHGFYESLPPNYNSTTKNYPLIVFLHGQGELGDGSPGALPRVLANGPPQKINAGTFPDPVTVNGQNFNFIVISPQLNQWPAWEDEQKAVNDVIQYAIDHYRVDITRIYLTGLSMGGGIAWEYASYKEGNVDYVKRLAGLLVIAGASYPEPERSQQMALDHLPVWATANQNDGTVPASYSIDYVQQMIDYGANPAPLLTIFPVSGHGGWATTYNTLTNSAGLTVYQWMLQYQRVGDDIVVNAGVILPIQLTDYRAELTGPSAITVSWTTGSEVNNKLFTLQRSADGLSFNGLDTIPATNKPEGDHYTYVDRSPLPGNNFYRLSQTDLDGKTTVYGTRKVTVQAGNASGSLKLSPNPATSNIYLELTQAGQGPLEIVLADVQGKTIRTWKGQKQGMVWAQSVDVSNLPQGNYFIRVQGAGISSVQQFSKR